MKNNLLFFKCTFVILMVFTLSAAAQQQRVTGKVTESSTGEALPGVTVQVKGLQVGAISQADGTYSVNLPEGSNTLVFSFVGYQTQEIAIAGRSTVDVALVEEVTALDEIVITGYSSEKKKDIIGSVAVVNTNEMLSTPTGNITNQLQGKAAGVSASSSGAPGRSARVRVRGFGTFGESEPLYIIDGTPGDINRINPNDVESVQVLKDAASAAVYGARAANGVIIVTTKKGQSGKTKITVDAYYGWQYVAKKKFPDVLNAMEWGQNYFNGLAGAGYTVGTPAWTSTQYGKAAEPVIPEYILAFGSTGNKLGGTDLEILRTSNPTEFAFAVNPDNYNFKTHQIVKSADTDWADEMFDVAPIQSYQVSASGGAGKNTYLLSVGYFDQISTHTQYDNFKRYTVRANSSLSPYDRIRIGENIQVSYEKGRTLQAYVDNAWKFHPLIPIRDIMGNVASTAAPGLVSTGGTTGMNPVLGPAKEFADGYENVGLFGNVYTELDLLKELTFRTSYGFDLSSSYMRDFLPIYYENAENQQPYPDRLLNNTINKYDWTWTNTLTYSKTIGKHVIKVLVGLEAVNNMSRLLGSERFGFTQALQKYEEFLVNNAGTGQQMNTGTVDKSRLFSEFGRLDYTYGDKYIFNATVRRDGSSRFGKNNRYGVFPSVAIGWRLSAEPFMQDIAWLTDLKLRASRGVIGNLSSLTANNQYTLFTGRDWYNYGISGSGSSTSPSYVQAYVGNPDAKWEKTRSTNVGLDLTVLQGKVTLSAEWFERKTQDLLVQNQAPTTGTAAIQPYVNVGEIQNRGVDITATYRGTVLGDLGYELSANFSKYNNEVLKVLDNPKAFIQNTVSGNEIAISRVFAGQPLAYFYGYKIDGFFNTQTEVDAYKAEYTNNNLPPAVGRWRIKDISGPAGVPDKVINDYDRTNIGSPHPDFQVNFSLSLNYKNFDFYTTLFWNQGGNIFNNARVGSDFNTMQFNRSARMLYDSWTPTHMNAKLPKADILDTYSAKYATDYFVEDATYIRLRTVQLGYTVPSAIANKIRIDNLRVYVQVQNPWTWIKEYSGMDPDAVFSGNASGGSATSGSDNGQSIATRGADLRMGVSSADVPTPQQILVGVNLTF
jgi:TonB-dependent starch-binding outer membrane protein SusC